MFLEGAAVPAEEPELQLQQCVGAPETAQLRRGPGDPPINNNRRPSIQKDSVLVRLNKLKTFKPPGRGSAPC